MGRRAAPRSIEAAISALVESVEPVSNIARIQSVWEQAVGSTVSAQGRPTAEYDGVVTISCRSSAWASELDLMSDEIIGKLNGELGASIVTRLRCIATIPRTWADGS